MADRPPVLAVPAGDPRGGVDGARHCQFTLAPPRHFIYPAILLLLAEEPRHGYRLVDPLLRLGFGPTMDRPSVYRALADLHRDGLLETWSAPPTAGSVRHMYAVTPEGFQVLEAWMGIVADEAHSLGAIAERFARLRPCPASNGDGPASNGNRNGHAGDPLATDAYPMAGDTLPTDASASTAPSGLGVPMHELSIASSIADAVGRHADGASVERVRIEVGHLRQVVPASLTFCWEMVTDGTGLAGCALDVTEVPATIACDDCKHTQTLDEPIFLCGACGSTSVTVTSGQELLIRSYDLADA